MSKPNGVLSGTSSGVPINETHAKMPGEQAEPANANDTPERRSARRKHLERVENHNLAMASIARRGCISVSGNDLTLAKLVMASHRGVKCNVGPQAKELPRVEESVHVLNNHLTQGRTVYGITTGVGGSADGRTFMYEDLQKSLVQHHHAGVLLSTDIGAQSNHETLSSLSSHALPRPVVRAALITRCNSLLRGHSAVRREVIESALALLSMDFIPVVPLRGSISASGDLSPLSYFAGALEGNSGIFCDCKTDQGREIIPSNEALQRAGLKPITLGPKEGLGIMNGTAVSCAAASLALHGAHYLALITQALTGMCVEALRGTRNNYDSFIAAIRPHAGQIEAAANISNYLQGSSLAGSHDSDSRIQGLYQDRYALRTATQWIGPQLEDLNLAASQLDVELNSTTDNPLIDSAADRIHHGGNFQAAAVTSATEKTRSALQMLGRLLYSQLSEVVNPMTNNDLPPNLSFDNPELSFTFKGVDINMTAYMSELAYLASPVSTHVLPAEMNNQGVNSLALISARYTLSAVEVMSIMCALHLYTLCQALDLQVLHTIIMDELESRVSKAMLQHFSKHLPDRQLKAGGTAVFNAVKSSLSATKTKNLPDRAKLAAEATIPQLLSLLAEDSGTSRDLHSLNSWRLKCSDIVSNSIVSAKVQFAHSAANITCQFLSRGSKLLYEFIRIDLDVCFHKGVVEHATFDGPSSEGLRVPPEKRVLIGTQVSRIYEALRSGRMNDILVQALAFKTRNLKL